VTSGEAEEGTTLQQTPRQKKSPVTRKKRGAKAREKCWEGQGVWEKFSKEIHMLEKGKRLKKGKSMKMWANAKI